MFEAILVLVALAVYLHRSRLHVAAAPPHGATRYGDDPVLAGRTALTLAHFEAQRLTRGSTTL